MADRIIVGATLALAIVYFYATSQIRTFAFGDPIGPRTFPEILCVGLVVVAVMLLFEMAAARKTNPEPETGEARPSGGKSHLPVVVATVVVTAVYFAVFVPLGYVLATTIYLLGMTAYFNRGKWIANCLTSVLYCVVSYMMFTRVLGVSLPAGVLPF